MTATKRALRYARRHMLLAATLLALAGVAWFAMSQRNQIREIHRNAERIERINVDRNKRRAEFDRANQQKAFDDCVRNAILRRHVNATTKAIRALLLKATPRNAKERRQLRSLLRAFTNAPGPETKAECAKIAPPPDGLAPGVAP